MRMHCTLEDLQAARLRNARKVLSNDTSVRRPATTSPLGAPWSTEIARDCNLGGRDADEMQS